MFKEIKKNSTQLLTLSDDQRSLILKSLAQKIRHHLSLILLENQKDLTLMDQADPKYQRLMLNEASLHSITQDIETIADLTSPIGRILEHRTRLNGLDLTKISVPLGVVAVIYESRPNVTLDVFALCFKTGNACILKGGKEADHSNKILAKLIHETLNDYNLSHSFFTLMPSTRESTQMILNAVGLIDVCIPRGSHSLIEYVRDNAKIPVIETGAGIVHTYFDKYGDLGIGRAIILNAKTRKVSVCNALDTLIIHRQRLLDLPLLVKDLIAHNVFLFADSESYEVLQNNYPSHLLSPAQASHFGTEFLDYKMSLKTVSSMGEALDHVHHYSSGHSEAIVTEDTERAQLFLQTVDAAAVYHNASTAFSDGGQFGMGAEIGISTQKLHARGPMGLEALTSYKWIIQGTGQTRN